MKKMQFVMTIELGDEGMMTADEIEEVLKSTALMIGMQLWPKLEPARGAVLDRKAQTIGEWSIRRALDFAELGAEYERCIESMGLSLSPTMRRFLGSWA